ncbi:methyl-accepting chemotaxis protein [Vibrio sp. TH_r3]|uniref:methyl-accepting chemotaxis protein n=1 Tax=Vibrio sp. TH_r3 TaxID=3082084 RepID=UPI002955BE1F|nr:methyl-accepting chemotaxis protein [Vibrio sp. TH_r3]MDV7104613.1 methyl-accepting chemotaxis protein [Vibrio sp. TH_r3]
MPLKSIKQRYSLVLVIFIALITILTTIGIQQWVKPELQAEEEKNLSFAVKDIATEIKLTLTSVQAQQRSTTQLIPNLESAQIDLLLPYLVDQYGNQLVFGGGIWPMPNKRVAGTDRASSFYHRDVNGQLIVNTYWNSDEAPDYFTQAWHKAGQNAPKGQCVWANAYKDGASLQPRTNCAMGIYQGSSLYGVSTVDVTLGFFNDLVADKERELNAEILIVEADGKILSTNKVLSNDNVILTELSAQSYPFATTLNEALKTSEFRKEFEQNGEKHILLIQQVEGTPWLIAVAKPTNLLTMQTQEIMSTLAMIQLPMVVILLAVLLYAFTSLGNRFKTLKENVDTLSAGDADLSIRLPIKGEDELDAVSESMNNFISYLQKLITNVIEANRVCNEQITAMSAVTEKTLMVLDKHVKETDMVATAVNELSSSAQEVAGYTNQSTDITNSAHREAQNSEDSARKATDSVGELMKNVELTSENVGKMQDNAASIEGVLQVIRGIAEQTNLLALNAAIEAARAGEMGRGFAVVADEVRNLAAKTQDSTTEVAEMLDILKSGVETTVTSMSETREQCQVTSVLTNEVTEGLATMQNSVSKVDDVSVQIATAANEQSHVADDINRSMVSISTMLTELHSHGQTSEEHAKALQNANRALQDLVDQFKV